MAFSTRTLGLTPHIRRMVALENALEEWDEGIWRSLHEVAKAEEELEKQAEIQEAVLASEAARPAEPSRVFEAVHEWVPNPPHLVSPASVVALPEPIPDPIPFTPPQNPEQVWVPEPASPIEEFGPKPLEGERLQREVRAAGRALVPISGVEPFSRNEDGSIVFAGNLDLGKNRQPKVFVYLPLGFPEAPPELFLFSEGHPVFVNAKLNLTWSPHDDIGTSLNQLRTKLDELIVPAA